MTIIDIQTNKNKKKERRKHCFVRKPTERTSLEPAESNDNDNDNNN